MSSSGNEVHKAIIVALKADAGVGALIADRIYDKVPRDVVYPYSHIVSLDGQPDIETDAGDGWECMIRIDTWAKLRPTVQQILDAQAAVIDDQALSLDSQNNVIGELADERTLNRDNIWFQGIQRYRFVTHS